ncbi:carboxypeptidase-like regulatory domain-containing protein [Chitinophaga varians]|uniref:carboxypeptidase-like regulatory domain-containing protein n=1 Tax=Chitinophaga varians TaxID=2202339 RepID=UPI00165FAF4F|nr:carboxypeptidase-like regulatory domain-containing protein [Chitinophaga varians]MBC9909442.1 hypothetical protein [Chitinophaga varians]
MKKILPILPVIAFAYLLTNCGKKEFDDISGNKKLSGRVYLIDTLGTAQEPQMLKSKKVYIRYSGSSTSDYLYSVVSGADGYFTFTNLSAQSYTVFTEEIRSGIKYVDAQQVDPGQKDSIVLRLKPDTLQQRLLNLIVTDKNKERVSGAIVYVYSSQLVADHDSAITGTGSILADTTSIYGNKLRIGLGDGKYYFKAKRALTDTILRSRALVNTTISGNGLKDISIAVE